MNQRGMRAAAEKPYLVVYHDESTGSGYENAVLAMFLLPACAAALSGRPARRVAVAPWRYATREARAEFTLDGDVQYSSRAPADHARQPTLL